MSKAYRLDKKCTHITERFESNHDKVHAIKHCKDCNKFRNKKMQSHNDNKRAI